MGKAVAVSFETDNIKIVHASLKRKTLSIDKTETVDYDEFDDYLKKEKSDEFIVTYDFKEAYHGVITVPSLKSKYIKKIIGSELKKVTGQKDISFIFTPVEERRFENRKVLDVFYFAISNEVFLDIVGRFYDFGKSVKAVYPTVYPVASLISHGTSGEACMGVLGSGNERTAFLTEKGSIYFLRNYDSIESEFSNYDVQNINMTISYCDQNIKKKPSSVMLLGNITESSEISSFTSEAMACLLGVKNVKCKREILYDYMLPIGTFYAQSSSNILSRNFRNIYLLKQYMKYISRVFVIIAVLFAGLLFIETGEISGKKKTIELAEQREADIESIFSEHVSREEKLSRYVQLTGFLNSPEPDISSFLMKLAGIRAENLRVNLVEAVVKSDDLFSVLIEGAGISNKYAGMQDSFREMSRALSEIKGVLINNSAFDMNSKKFSIELEVKRGE